MNLSKVYKVNNGDYMQFMMSIKHNFKNIKKLEYSKEIYNLNNIIFYEKLFKEKVLNNNMYEKELEQIKKNLPLVSIIIPVYNGSNYMKEAIDSALNQDYPNIEILVINDGSNDNGETERIAKSYKDKIKYLKKENGGVSTALNLGIKEMKGEYFSWLSHDDRYYKNKISTQINYLIDNDLLNEKVITYTNYDIIDENSEIKGITQFEIYNPNEKPEIALLRGLISGTALLIPKEAFQEFGVFDEKYRCIQDYLLFFEFMKSYKYIHIPLVTNSTRVHSGQVTNVNPKVIEENNFLWTYMQENISEETKIKIDGSLYDFYINMETYLRINMGNTKNDYKEARQHSLNKAEILLSKGKERLSNILTKTNEQNLLSILIEKYNEEYPRINNKENYEYNESEKKDLEEVIKTMGLYNVLTYLYNYTNDNKFIYYEMITNIRSKKTHYPKIKSNISIKFKYMKKI